MFYYHLPCGGEKENFHNCLGGMAAEHFYKLNTDYKGQCLGKKVCKKSVSICMTEVPAVVRISRRPDRAITIRITMDKTTSV